MSEAKQPTEEETDARFTWNDSELKAIKFIKKDPEEAEEEARKQFLGSPVTASGDTLEAHKRSMESHVKETEEARKKAKKYTALDFE